MVMMIPISEATREIYMRNGLKLPDGTTTVSEPIIFNYKCQRCKDTGYLVPEVPVGHEQFGRSVRCRCNSRDLSALYMKRSGLKKSERDFHFQFQPMVRTNPRPVQHVMRMIRKRRHGMAVLYGKPDAGKSGLMKAAVALACNDGLEAVYVQASQILDELKASFDTTQSFDAVLSRYQRVPVLAIDEFETVNPTTFALEQLFKIVDSRSRELDEKTTLFATNKEACQQPDKSLVIFGGKKQHVWLEKIDSRMKDARGFECQQINQRGNRNA